MYDCKLVISFALADICYDPEFGSSPIGRGYDPSLIPVGVSIDYKGQKNNLAKKPASGFTRDIPTYGGLF